MPCAVGFAAVALTVLFMLHCLVKKSRRRARSSPGTQAQDLEAPVGCPLQRSTAVLVLMPGPANEVKTCLVVLAFLAFDGKLTILSVPSRHS